MKEFLIVEGDADPSRFTYEKINLELKLLNLPPIDIYQDKISYGIDMLHRLIDLERRLKRRGENV